MNVFVPRVMFYPSLGYTVLMSKFTSRDWYNRVDENVLIGALPFKSMSKMLIDKENVKAVLTLNEKYELKMSNSKKAWAALGVEQLLLSTPDLFGTAKPDTLKQGVDFILAHKGKGDGVYVHCKAGRTRSAMYVVCYLMQEHKWDPDQAYKHLKEKRPHVWIRSAQMESIKSYYKQFVQQSDKKSGSHSKKVKGHGKSTKAKHSGSGSISTNDQKTSIVTKTESATQTNSNSGETSV